jgi:RHS repeat-associated protein
MAPTLTLVYNSNVSNGMMGMGWYLNGLPEIKRDFSYGATYSAQDHFLYNGEKLIAGSDGYYRLVRETFERIKPVNLSSANSYWEVTMKNGSKLYFGYQAAEHAVNTFGRISAAGESEKVYLWALSKVMDIHGNYYTVEYSQDSTNGDCYPERITYTRNESKPLAADRTVEFSYETRTDHHMIFNPTRIDQDRRLKWITIKIGGKLLRKYRLDYEYGAVSGRSRMIAVQEYGGDGDLPAVPWVETGYRGTGKTLPLTKFEYLQGTSFSSNQANSRTDLKKGGVKYTPGDFNGDGKTDLIITTDSGSVWQINTGTGCGYQAYQIQYSNSSYTLGNVQFTPADLNGDGRTDVIATTSAGSYWLLSNGTGNSYRQVQAHSRSDLSLGKVQFTTGDFNGDGKTDIIATTASGSYWYHSSGTGNSYQIYYANLRADLHLGEVQFTPGDFNGDGKTDLIYTTSAGSYWYISDGNDQPYHAYSPYYRVDLTYGKVQYIPGDFNGDGKTDLVVSTSQGSYWYISTGNGGPYTYPYSRSDLRLGEIKINPGDFNGDGKTDLLVSNSSGSVWYISKWENNSYQTVNQLYRSDLNTEETDFITTDFNGDGKTDTIITTSSVSLWNISNGTNNLPPDLLTTIKTPLGGKIGISYSTAADVSGTVVADAKTYPDVANANAAFLVTRLVFDDGQNHLITDNYNYSNSMIHNGLAYEQAGLGFAWIEKKNSYSGVIRTFYRQNDIDLRLKVDKEEIYGTNGKLYTEKSYVYQKRPNSNNSAIKFIYPEQETLKNFNGEGGTPVTYQVENDFDEYGNPILINDSGDISVTGDETRTERNFNRYLDSGTYLFLLEYEKKYGIRLDGQEGLAAETRFYYNPNHTLAHQEQENGEQDVVTQFSYDDYGNVTSMTDGNGNTTTYTYDEKYQTYLRTKTLKFTEETIYDELMRSVKRKDANGQIWETTYDYFSREKTKVAPGDPIASPTTKLTYPDEFVDTSGNMSLPGCLKTEKKVTDGNYIEVYNYTDGLERTIQEKAEAKGGWVTVDHVCDSAGREAQTSMPYFSATSNYTAPDSDVKYTTYQFDPIGRLAKTESTDQTAICQYYGKQETLTVDQLGHVTNQKVVGNIETNSKYTGVYPDQVEYSKTTIINACDGVKKVDAVGKEFVTTIDMLGRTIKSVTPVNGTWSHSFDANHNLKTQTDAKNQTITLEYDPLNRLTKKNYPDGSSVNYYYDETGHGYANGRLTRSEYPDGSESYNYDARGRKTEITQIIGGIGKTKQLTYNSLDQVIAQTLPDGEVVTNSYDNGGMLSGLKGSSTYLSDINYYASGKTNKMVYGNGVRTDFDYYDTAGENDASAGVNFSYRLKQIKVYKNGDLLNLNYEYDKSYNIKVKRDVLNVNYTETYGYDDLSRLISAEFTSYGNNKTIQYDTINNITRKDNRNYQYDTSNPYKLVNDGKYSYTYDANGSMTNRNDGRVIGWDYENRVTTVATGGNTESFFYDDQFRRVKKVSDNITTYYFFNDYEEEYKAGVKSKTVKYYFGNKMRIAENSSADGIRYYHQDHLGSSTAITDSTGALVLRNNYAPYGEDAASEGKTAVRYKFTDKEKDSTGLYYFGARFYDPEVGRFISVDPACQGLNWYSYCGNNPVNRIDPDGKWFGADDVFTGPVDEIVVIGGLAVAAACGSKWAADTLDNMGKVFNQIVSNSKKSDTGAGYKVGDRTPGGRVITDHAAGRMNERGFSDKVVDRIIDNNRRTRDKEVDPITGKVTWKYEDSRGNVVITNENGTKVVTTYNTKNKEAEYEPSNKEKSKSEDEK